MISNMNNHRSTMTSKEEDHVPPDRKIRIAIIGGGVSGILAIKACKEEEDLFSEIVCYERTSDLGGLWKYRDFDTDNEDQNNNKVSSSSAKAIDMPTVMKGTIANSSKEMSAFSDFPPSPSTPNFMHHKLMYNYIEDYGRHFDCLKHIVYDHEVSLLSKANKGWKLCLRDVATDAKRTEYFDAVLVCTGHHGRPYIPTFPGQKAFRGKITHTQYYKTPSPFENQKVLVVGVGNSGLDCAVELSAVAENVILSTRSGCWILPRLGFRGGRPYDTSFLTRAMHFMKDLIPPRMISSVIETMLNKRFDHDLFGLRPAHPLFHEHPTINDQLASKILCGVIQVKGDVNEITETGVVFEGEDEELPVDSIILATGYHVDYSFLSDDLRDEILVKDSNSANLYKYVFPVIDDEEAQKTFGFIGVPNALGPLFPIAEIQSRWFVQVLKGTCNLPSYQGMREALVIQEEKRKRKFTDTPRHGVQVEWIPYLDEVASEMGCKVDFWSLFWSDFKLWSRLCFGPSVPYQYRLNGPHSWPEARQAIMEVKDRIEHPLRVKRTLKLGKDQVSTNVKYWDHNFFYTFFWGVIAVLVMDIFFLYAS